MAEKLSKNERREQAREQARLAREAEKKREKRTRLILQGGIVLGVLAVLAVVALVLTQTMKPTGGGPENMASGGVTFTENLEVVPTAALEAGTERQARDIDFDSTPVDVSVYVDYMCPACGNFEQLYGTVLENYIGSGDINLTVTPINMLDNQSLGTKYSTRAANAFACLVEQQPESAFAFHNLLLSADVQPAEQTTGLTDDQLVEQAEAAGATATNELKQCVKNQPYADFIAGNYKQVTEKGLLDLAPEAQLVGDFNTGELQTEGAPQRLISTPTVIVNGQQWFSTRDGDFETYLLKVKAELEKSGGATGGSTDSSEEEE